MFHEMKLVHLAVLTAVLHVVVAHEHEHCLDNDEDESSLLQTASTFQKKMHANDIVTAAFIDSNCTPNVVQDTLMLLDHITHDRNQSLIDRYLHDGKITTSGFPILNFVHIPKTAGDSFTLASAPLGEYGMGTAQMNAVDDEAKSYKNCVFQQMPPMDLEPGLAKSVYGESEIFCSVRNPYDRAWSAACHMKQYDPGYSSLSVDEIIRVSLEKYVDDRHFYVCFWVPQVDYLSGPQGCKHIIDFDHLESEYDQLMKQYGFDDLTLPPASATHACHVSCGKQNMSADTRVLFDQTYAKDIEFWNEFRHKRDAAA
jgi:hypothetical protein